MRIAGSIRLFLYSLLALGLAGLWTSPAQAQDCSVTSTSNGTFIGITSQGGGFGDPSNVEQFLIDNGVSGAQRVDKVDGFPDSGGSSCIAGESGNVNAQATDPMDGVWKSVNDQQICAVAIHAGGGQNVAVYTYDPPVFEGGWTTENNLGPQGQAQDISNIQFFTCDDVPPPPQGTVKIIKKTVDGNEVAINVDQNFPVLINGVQVDVLNTNGANPVGMVMTPVLTRAAGVEYTVSEDVSNLPPNIAQLGPTSCEDSEGAVENPFTLQANQDVVCTITNQVTEIEGAQFRVQKLLNAANGDPINGVNFEFTYTNPDGSTTVASNAGFSSPIEIEDLGVDVTITETQQANINATVIACSDQNGDSVNGNLSEGNVTIPANLIDDGDLWSCTFENVRREDPGKGRIVVKKKTIGGNDDFKFMISGDSFNSPNFELSNGQSQSFDLQPGTYEISEKDLPDGWRLKNIDCGSEGDRDGENISVDLEDGETITCTFTNFKEEDERMEDVVKVFINRRVRNLLDHGPDRSRIINRLDQQQPPSLKDTPPLKYSGTDVKSLTGGTASAVGSGAATLPGIGTSTSVFDKSRQSSAGSASGSLPFGISGDLSDGIPTGRFAFSLSEMREKAYTKEAAKIANAKAFSGLAFGGNPYGVDYGAIPLGLTPQRHDVWVEGHYSRYDDSTGGINRDGNFGIVYVGTDYAVSDRFLIGALVQFDWTDEDVRDADLSGSVDGWGWMIGPYIGAKLSPNLYFSARAAWGQSDNDIDLTDNAAGYRTGSFDTDRWLATAELTGNWYHGNLRITPSAEIAYGSEDQDAFRNSLGQRVGSNDATVGQFTFGPEFGFRGIRGDGTVVEPIVSIEGVWTFDDDDLRLSDGTPVGSEDLTGRVEAGLLVQRPNGWAWRLTGDYNGIGDSDFESYGVRAWVNIPLN